MSLAEFDVEAIDGLSKFSNRVVAFNPFVISIMIAIIAANLSLEYWVVVFINDRIWIIKLEVSNK